MTFRDTASLAMRNLGHAKLRTTLTTLGVSIGIASLAGMVSLGVGLQDQFVGRLTRSGLFDSITIVSASDLPGGLARLGGVGRQTFGRGRGGGRGGGPGAGPRVELNDDTLRDLATLPHVRDVFPNVRVPLQVKYNGEQESFAAAGIPMSAKGEGAFRSISYGQFFPNDSDLACMLSLDLAKRMNETDPGSLVGQTVTLVHTSPEAVAAILAGAAPAVPPKPEETPCRIAGIVERETGPGGIGVQVTPIMLPLARAKAMQVRANTYLSITVKVAGAPYTEDVEDAIRKKGLSAFSINDALQGAKRAFILLDIVLSLIGSIALAVSSLGIVNTMVMSILERTREIGIMKAIGGSDGDIRRIFLIEASAIGALGGVAGVALGWLVGRVINFGANLYIQQQGGPTGNLFSLPLWLIGGAIGFSIAVSLAAGSYPAARAARLNPIEALRHD
ncbi:MAG TPA: ABC transporter permease [Vicinamibacterales bacterium]|jgi:putative ABC transport system permease protein